MLLHVPVKVFSVRHPTSYNYVSCSHYFADDGPQEGKCPPLEVATNEWLVKTVID
jgi:hypothetical protein